VIIGMSCRWTCKRAVIACLADIVVMPTTKRRLAPNSIKITTRR
jgi:hypothetical protein